MFIDLYCYPYLSLTILSGFFRGKYVLYSSIGIIGSGTMGYSTSRFHGENVKLLPIKDDKNKKRNDTYFLFIWFFSLILCRAAPMLPEVTVCLAGLLKCLIGNICFFIQ